MAYCDAVARWGGLSLNLPREGFRPRAWAKAAWGRRGDLIVPIRPALRPITYRLRYEIDDVFLDLYASGRGYAAVLQAAGLSRAAVGDLRRHHLERSEPGAHEAKRAKPRFEAARQADRFR